MVKKNNNVYLDTIIVGSGLSSLNFIDTYSVNKKKIDVISPNANLKIPCESRYKIEALPPQMYNKENQVQNYFAANNLSNSKDSKILGSLNFGGLSNYWGLQMDNYINIENENIGKKTKHEIKKSFFDLLIKYKLVGKFNFKNKIYKNEFKIPRSLENFIKKKSKEYKICRPILAYGCKLKKDSKNLTNEKKNKITANNFLIKSDLKKKIILHNYYLDKITRVNNKYKLTCINGNIKKFFIVRKIILATGTIATTKLLMDFLKIKKEVKVYHHPRLIVAYLAKRKIDIKLNFIPSLLQIIGTFEKSTFSMDLRPGNESIISSITDISKLFYPLKYFLRIIKKRIIFSNILLSSKNSNVYLKKNNETFSIYTKKNDILKKLKKINLNIFSFLLKKNFIFPLFKTHFPGIGSDFHYFGTIPFNKNNKLSVNENCQLKNNKGIYIVDSSVFNFKNNKYPLGIVMANARRIGKLLS